MSRKQKSNSPVVESDPADLRAGSSVLSTGPAVEPEPTAERKPISILLVGLFIALLYWGDMYVMEHGADVSGKGGSFPAVVYDPYITYAQVEGANPEDPETKILKRGRQHYELLCAVCHQSTGLGNPATSIPPLAGSEWVLTEGPGRLIRIVLDAPGGEFEVAGKKYNNPQMPPWRDIPLLNDEELAALLSYVRRNKEWGHNASMVKPEKVKEVRAATASHAGRQWTAPELLQVPPQ
jgi:mono/diheme cytochrome c family protein